MSVGYLNASLSLATQTCSADFTYNAAPLHPMGLTRIGDASSRLFRDWKGDYVVAEKPFGQVLGEVIRPLIGRVSSVLSGIHSLVGKVSALIPSLPVVGAERIAPNGPLENAAKIKCNPLFDEMAERTIPCTLASRVDTLTLEGLPLNRFVLENRPRWAIDGWKECMDHSDRRLAEDMHDGFAAYSACHRAELLHAQAQVEEVLGNLTLAADYYSTASYWLNAAPDDWRMIRDDMTAVQMKVHLAVQKYMTRLQVLICEKPEEIEKAEELLLWMKDEGYFDYESPAHLLSLAFVSYENGDCPQVKKLLELINNLEKRGKIDLGQYVTRIDSCSEKGPRFRSCNGPIFSVTNVTDGASTARSLLEWLQARLTSSSS